MTLSPSVVQLFSMKPSAIPPCTPPRSQNSDSGIESVKSKKQGRANNNNNLNNFRGRGNSDPAVKKLQHNNANANKNKQAAVRASSLSPTKNLHTSSMSPKTAKKANYQTSSKSIMPFHGAARTPPRFGNGFKKQQSAPAGTGSRSSSHPTAIQTPSSPTFRKKQQSSTAMKTKNNNHIHSKNQDSDSGSASSGSNKSNKTKSFVRTASLHMSTPDNNNHHNQQTRQRNDNSFSNTIYRDEMWAGSAASPAATALPQPPIAWLRVKEEAATKTEIDDVETMLTHTTQKIASSEISARNATTTKSPLATSVQQMFASFNSPLVSTTA